MQERKPDEKLSRLRVTLLALLEHLREVLNVALARTPLVKGNVYEIARRCGTPNCRCTRGRLHRNMVLTWSEQGRSHMRSIPRARLAELRQKSAEYLRFRRARGEVSVLPQKILKVLDQLAQSYPSPRKRHDVPLWVYMASNLSMRFHGEHHFHAFPFLVRCSSMIEAFGPAMGHKATHPETGDISLRCEGFNEKNSYDRQTPCDQDYLRK